MPAAYGAGYGYVLTALRAYASAAVLCARALRALARIRTALARPCGRAVGAPLAGGPTMRSRMERRAK